MVLPVASPGERRGDVELDALAALALALAAFVAVLRRK